MKSNVPVPSKLSVNVAFAGRFSALRIRLSRSGSLALTGTFRFWPSATDCGPMAASVGVRLISLTVIATSSVSASAPSLTMTRTLYKPL